MESAFFKDDRKLHIISFKDVICVAMFVNANSYSNPITYLARNCGHQSTSLQDRHQLITISDLPTLLTFLQETKLSKDKATNSIDAQFPSHRTTSDYTSDTISCLWHAYIRCAPTSDGLIPMIQNITNCICYATKHKGVGSRHKGGWYPDARG